MPESSSLSNRGRAYVWGVILAGTVAVASSIYDIAVNPIDWSWSLLAALTILSGSATVRLPSVPASLSVSETFVFTSVLWFGSSAGTLTVALDGLIISLWLSKRRKELHRVLFNMAAPALSIWVASNIFFWLSGLEALSQSEEAAKEISNNLSALFVFTTVYFLLNSWLITFAVGFETGAKPFHIWRTHFVWLSLNFLCGASVAALLTISGLDIRYLGAIIPLLLVLYLTYRTSMGRVEDANRHLQQVNRLYLSTIETLAMAIDAKDQVTHGHIRRVQSYAIGLAKALGVRDGTLLHAIEAASLLHDMGKLAIPEHILNKPGKLTGPEFERMKLHAGIGADILSAIEFPYPVVPIVRHHHENWNGSGYPTGIAGTDIPIGARILSVVDCFDALTSDRPYRPRLADEEAIRILLDRRGSMYDPLVVDTFIRVHQELAPEVDGQSEPPAVIAQIALEAAKGAEASAFAVGAVNQASRAQSDRVLIVHSILNSQINQISPKETFELAWSHLRSLVPATHAVLYEYDASSDELRCDLMLTPTGRTKFAATFPVGQRLSGWVAANRRPMVNADPSLDLERWKPDGGRSLRSALSVPLVAAGSTIGVLTLYAEGQNAFTDDDTRMMNTFGSQLAHAAIQWRASAEQRWDEETGLPTAGHLRRFFDNERPGRLGLLRISVARRNSGDLLLKEGVEAVRASLRLGDLVFRYDSVTLICVLPDAQAADILPVVARIEKQLHDNPDSSIVLNDFAIASYPDDGRTLDDLLKAMEFPQLEGAAQLSLLVTEKTR